MQNARFLKIGLALLLLINISTLGYLWMDSHHRQGPPQGQNAFNFLCHELNLTDAQVQQYDELRQEHHHSIEMIQEHGHQLRERLFDMLHTTPVDSAAVKRMADSVAATQEQIELATFYHFSKLRTILDADQQKRFDNVIQEALRMMAPQPPPRGGQQGPPPGPR